ncbi:hypothetical protein NX059_007830 [Plenodomus lindquistii]|nr:hypothetical protein NX059_007830 [Plenodomus lindquistii]
MKALFSEANSKQTRLYQYLERLGFRAYTPKPGSKGGVSFTKKELKDFYNSLREAANKHFGGFKSPEDTQNALLNDASPVHEAIRNLLTEFGPKIWNAGFASRSLDILDVEYPRHLLYENLEDRSLIERAIYGWIIRRARRVGKGSLTSLDESQANLEEASHSDSMYSPDEEPLYRAATAVMFPPSRRTGKEPSPPLFPSAPLANRQVARKTHHKKRTALEYNDNVTMPYPLRSRRISSESAGPLDKLNFDTPPVPRMPKRKRAEVPAGTTFKNLEDIAGSKGIKRWNSTAGSSLLRDFIRGPSNMPLVERQATKGPQRPSSVDEDPTNGELQGANTASKFRSNTSDDETHDTTASDDTVDGPTIPRAFCTKSTVRGDPTSLTADLNLSKDGYTLPIRGTTSAQDKSLSNLSHNATSSQLSNSSNSATVLQEPASTRDSPQEPDHHTADLQKDKLDLALGLFDVLMSGSPEKHDLVVLEKAIRLVETVSIADAQRLHRNYGDASTQYRAVLQSWLACVNVLVSFRRLTNFSGEKSERTAFLKTLPMEDRLSAYQLLARPAAELAIDMGQFSRTLARVLFPMASWPDGLSIDEMEALTSVFNGRLVNWFKKEEV